MSIGENSAGGQKCWCMMVIRYEIYNNIQGKLDAV